MKVAIDFGITNTDVAIQDNNELIFHTFSAEEIDAAYILKIFSELNLDTEKITHIAVTGGKSSDLKNHINTIPIIKLNEIQAIGYGARELYEINDSKFLAVSTGTGTACVASTDGEFNHLGGISIGGGTLQGLSNLITGINNPNEIEKLSAIGNKNNLDALIGEVVNNIGSLNPDITASNFCKARENTNHSIEDVMSSISNMVGEVIGTIAYLNALLIGVDNVYFIGRVSTMNSVRNGIEKRLNLAGVTGNYIDNQEFGNAIGSIAYLNANT
jgi:type II pantothenate kinase